MKRWEQLHVRTHEAAPIASVRTYFAISSTGSLASLAPFARKEVE